ncbi:SRPBCC domain-containing protein [bacterium SCSIO 12643]|nr:SRPBCC domain-containing protein [bacterium SCSIO 12643]
MQTLYHTFHIDSTFEKVFESLTTIDGLSGWWTKTTSGDANLNGTVFFKFAEYATFEMKVVQVQENLMVVWKSVSGNPDWEGTHIAFKLSENDNKVMVQFTHGAFSDDYSALGNINFSWGRYLESLRNYCEKGVGAPFEE